MIAKHDVKISKRAKLCNMYGKAAAVMSLVAVAFTGDFSTPVNASFFGFSLAQGTMTFASFLVKAFAPKST